MTDPATSSQTISGIAALLQAVAWPTAILVLLIVYRAKIGNLLDVFTKKLEAATKLKLWQLEIESTVQEIGDVVNRAGEQANRESLAPTIPADQLDAAEEVSKKLQRGPIPEARIVGVVRRQLDPLVRNYERLRTDMPSGPMRTRAMNEVAAKMRVLALAARPLLHSLMSSQIGGERLAAICILQVAPEFEFFLWLIDRIKTESQPFLFFQAAVAVLQLVEKGPYRDSAVLEPGIRDALRRITEFKGGTPDPNTIDVLEKALQQLR